MFNYGTQIANATSDEGLKTRNSKSDLLNIENSREVVGTSWREKNAKLISV
jgi:hypothetical protein